MIFCIDLPVGAVALLLLARTARSPHHNVPFDWLGQVTAILAMGGLTYGAIEAGASGFAAPQVVIAFLVAQARGAHPIMPLDCFRSRNVSVAMAVGFAFMVGYYGLPFVMSLYLQQLHGLSSLSARITEWLSARTLLAQPATFIHGMRTSLLIAAGIALATAAASLSLRKAQHSEGARAS